MKNKKIKIGLAIALPSAMTFSLSATDSSIALAKDALKNEIKIISDPNILQAKLLGLATIHHEGALPEVAMCYASSGKIATI